MNLWLALFLGAVGGWTMHWWRGPTRESTSARRRIALADQERLSLRVDPSFLDEVELEIDLGAGQLAWRVRMGSFQGAGLLSEIDALHLAERVVNAQTLGASSREPEWALDGCHVCLVHEDPCGQVVTREAWNPSRSRHPALWSAGQAMVTAVRRSEPSREVEQVLRLVARLLG